MKVLVAGATGAIGRRLVPMLIADGHDVVGMVRSEQGARAVEAMAPRTRALTRSTRTRRCER